MDKRTILQVLQVVDISLTSALCCVQSLKFVRSHSHTREDHHATSETKQARLELGS